MQYRYRVERRGPSMSTPGLFVPTYGQPAKVHALGKPKNNNGRVIPSKSAASRPLLSKRSLMPSLVFNGKIEYVQVSALPGRYCSRGYPCRVSMTVLCVFRSSIGVCLFGNIGTHQRFFFHMQVSEFAVREGIWFSSRAKWHAGA